MAQNTSKPTTTSSTSTAGTRTSTSNQGFFGSLSGSFLNLIQSIVRGISSYTSRLTPSSLTAQSRGTAGQFFSGLSIAASTQDASSYQRVPTTLIPQPISKGTQTAKAFANVNLPSSFTKDSLSQSLKDLSTKKIDFSKLKEVSTFPSLPTAASTFALPSQYQQLFFPTKTSQTTERSGSPQAVSSSSKTTTSPLTYSVNIPLDTGQTITVNLTPQGEELFGLRTSAEDFTTTPQGTTMNFNQGSGGEFMTLSGSSTGIMGGLLGGSTPIMGHIIQPGETLTKIAQQYGTTIDEILKLNQDNKRAIKSPDLIIAGEVIRVPYKQPTQPKPEAQASAGLLSGQPKTAEEINRQAQNILQKYEALKQGLPTEIKPEDVQPLMMYMFGDMIRQMQEVEARYREIFDPYYYQRQYQQFLDQSGIPQLYQQYFDLNKILNSTRDDVLREAQAVGGIVTQSQIEEVVNWRTSIIKSEMQTLADMIELKEKSLDRMMKYVELDRKAYSNYLDNVLGINERKQKIIMDALKWNLDWQEEIIKRNTQKLDTALKMGALADYSDELLLEMANPDSFLYTGYTLPELFALRNAARLIQDKKQEEIRKMQEQLERQKQQMELQRKRLELQRKRLELQKEKEENKKQSEKEKSEKKNKSSQLKSILGL